MSEKKVDVFDLDGIRRLLELMKENNVSELDLEEEGRRLKLSRASGAVQAVPVPAQPVVSAPAAPQPAEAEKAEPAADDPKFVKTIASPMVGTFYASSSPDKAPFVKVGDVVSPEKTVCIIEAMKVFNDVQAEISGKIVAVLAKNGDPVEYGAPLFKVDVRG